MIGDCQGVITGRNCDDAAGTLFRCERQQLYQRAALLEGVGDLQVLVLDRDLGAGEVGELGSWQEGRAHDGTLDLPCGLADVVKGRDHAGRPSCVWQRPMCHQAQARCKLAMVEATIKTASVAFTAQSRVGRPASRASSRPPAIQPALRLPPSKRKVRAS